MLCSDFERALYIAKVRAIEASSNLQGQPIGEEERCAVKNCRVYAIARALDGRSLPGDEFSPGQVCHRTGLPPSTSPDYEI